MAPTFPHRLASLLLICFSYVNSFKINTNSIKIMELRHDQISSINPSQASSFVCNNRNVIKNNVKQHHLSKILYSSSSSSTYMQSSRPSIRMSMSMLSTQPIRTAISTTSITSPHITNSRHMISNLIKLLITPLSALLTIISPAIVGGILSGSLHAVTGPDHLAALLPPSVGHPGWYGMRLGALWGLGHGFSAIFLGLCAFFLKGQMSSQFTFLQKISTIAESVVGITLMFIGFVGIKDNLGADVSNSEQNELVDGSNSEGKGPLKSSKAIFANGMLHGFSWDGAPSLAPALAMTSWRSAFSFLIAYCFGTMVAMSITAGAVGEGSMRLGKAVNNPNLPRNLSMISSVFAILIGAFWVAKSFMG